MIRGPAEQHKAPAVGDGSADSDMHVVTQTSPVPDTGPVEMPVHFHTHACDGAVPAGGREPAMVAQAHSLSANKRARGARQQESQDRSACAPTPIPALQQMTASWMHIRHGGVAPEVTTPDS